MTLLLRALLSNETLISDGMTCAQQSYVLSPAQARNGLRSYEIGMRGVGNICSVTRGNRNLQTPRLSQTRRRKYADFWRKLIRSTALRGQKSNHAGGTQTTWDTFSAL